MLAPELTLPPPFTLVTLREVGDAFAHAHRDRGRAAAPARWSMSAASTSPSSRVVLEPEEPLRSARRAFYAGMAALADALAAYAPPEKPIDIDWPDAIRVDGGLVGGGRLGLAARRGEDEPPPWLVFGAHDPHGVDDRRRAGRCIRSPPRSRRKASPMSAPGELVESFARHLMVHDRCLAGDGFGAVAQRISAAAAAREEACAATSTTTAICWCAAWARPRSSASSLLPALATPSWLDPKTRRAAT